MRAHIPFALAFFLAGADASAQTHLKPNNPLPPPVAQNLIQTRNTIERGKSVFTCTYPGTFTGPEFQFARKSIFKNASAGKVDSLIMSSPFMAFDEDTYTIAAEKDMDPERAKQAAMNFCRTLDDTDSLKRLHTPGL